MKYYTPSKDEIHINSEYDVLVDDKWVTDTFEYDINDNIRMKYLDADDIISEGFLLIGETLNSKIFSKKKETHRENININVVYNKIGDYPMISIDIDDDIVLNNCFCYNRNEFRFLINRLNL
jgi:hypothetical protein